MVIAILQFLDPLCKDQYTKMKIENFTTSLLNEDDDSIIDHKLLKLSLFENALQRMVQDLAKCVEHTLMIKVQRFPRSLRCQSCHQININNHNALKFSI